MYPILFNAGNITIYAYGTFLAIALFAGLYMGRLEFKRRDIDPDLAYDLALAIALGGIIGARLFFVIGHWDYYSVHLVELIQLQKGGLVYYGGFFGGALAVYLVVRRKKIELLKVADGLAAPIALGLAIGRIGCLLNGCCYGLVTSLPIGIAFDGVVRQPTQLYSLFFNLTLFAIVFFVLEKREVFKKPGNLFIAYVGMYSFGRFWLEFLRTSQRLLNYFTFSQLLSAVLFTICLVFLITRYRAGKL